ncbi:hypothetical protein COOONC_19841, partial [Cooperia oncophora]
LMEHSTNFACQPNLFSTVSKDALVMADVTCRNLLDEAKNHQLLQLSTYERPVMQGTLTRPRKSLSFGEIDVKCVTILSEIDQRRPLFLDSNLVMQRYIIYTYRVIELIQQI